jgi:hypothetical protein
MADGATPTWPPIISGMRLLLTWLVGVPLLVCSMVLARAALVPAPAYTMEAPAINARACLRKMQLDRVPLVVPDQRNRRACDALAIQQ